MKKVISITLLSILFAVLIISCGDKDDDSTAIAEITVKKDGSFQSGITVYMFDKDLGPSTNFFRPSYADRSVITESNGTATFTLQETFDLDINNETTLYFGVFDNNNNVLGSTGISIQKGETKSATINY